MRMTRLIGPSRTKDLVFSARHVTAEVAHQMGILDHLVIGGANAAQVHQEAYLEAIAIARSMASNGPVALRAAKVAIDKGMVLDTESALDWERACYERCLGTKDRLEGLKAFAEKRKPKYRGE